MMSNILFALDERNEMLLKEFKMEIKLC